MKNQQLTYFYAALTILCWITVPTAFKIGLQYQDSFQLLLGSTIISLIILFLAFLLSGKYKEIRSLRKRDLINSAYLGFLNPFIYYLFLFKAYSILPGQVAQPLNMIWPIVLVLISAPLLKQKIHLWSILAMVISFTGVILISSQEGGRNFNIKQLPGIILALSSSIIWSFYWILNVKDKRDDLTKLLLNFMFSLFYLMLVAPLLGKNLPVQKEAWFAIIYVGSFEMGLAFIFWLKALSLSESTDRISNLIYICPFFSLFFLHYFAGEKIYFTTILGLLLIVSGIVF